MMQVRFPNAVRGQLLTFSTEEKAGVVAQLEYLAQDPATIRQVGRRAPDEADIWAVRLAGDIRALLRIEPDFLTVLALVPEEQLQPYLADPGKQLA
jgi:hypothetical protein